MFGKGVYFADMSSKSAGYCASYNSNNMALLMLCDVELGDPMLELMNAEYNAGQHAKKQGKLATLGKGRTVPAAWKDAGCVHPDLRGVLMPDTASPPKDSDDSNLRLQYNEYIVYDVAQIRIRYLLLVEMK
jgi:poly [ADP-ribose] polymerase